MCQFETFGRFFGEKIKKVENFFRVFFLTNIGFEKKILLLRNCFSGFLFFSSDLKKSFISLSLGSVFLFSLVQHHEVLSHFVADVKVDDPVHQVETGEGHRKEYSRVLVDVRRRNAHHLLQVFPAGHLVRAHGSHGHLLRREHHRRLWRHLRP